MKFQRRKYISEDQPLEIDEIDYHSQYAEDEAHGFFHNNPLAAIIEIIHYEDGRLRCTVRNRQRKIIFQLKTLTYKKQEIPFPEK